MAQLVEILTHTYNPNPQLRKQAELALAEFKQSPGSCLQFLALVGDVGMHRDLRLASCISMKNTIKDYWSRTATSDHEKDQIKHNLLAILLPEQDNSIRGLLAETIRAICETDYPIAWPQLLPSLLQEIRGPDLLRTFNALTALRKVVKRYEYKPREERQILNDIVQASFPWLQELMGKVIDSNAIEAAHVMRLSLKIFWSATMYALPEVEGVDVNMWFASLGRIMDKTLPEASEGTEPRDQPLSADDRKNWPWWKLKKWAARIVTQFIQRYGNPRYAAVEYKAFAQHFRANVANLLLGPVMNTLARKVSGAFVTDDVHRMSLTYVASCVEMSPTYKAIKPHLDFVLFNVIFPSLCLSMEEIALFNDDPSEFVRKVHDPMEDWLDPRLAATNLLQMLARYRQKDVLPRLMPFLHGLLTEYMAAPPDRRDYRAKDGVLVAIGSIAKILKESKTYARHLDTFLIAHVIPEFESPVPWVRSRAYWIIDFFEDSDFSGSMLQPLVQGLLKGLGDVALPVQNAAACSIRHIITAEGTADLLRPVLPQLIAEYFRIMNDVENNSVLSSLQAIVEKFGAEIKDMAPAMVVQLLAAFQHFAGSGNDDDEAAWSASECLDTITAVLDAVQEELPTLTALEAILQPLLIRDGDSCYEYLDNGLNMLSYLTYYPEGISPAMWTLCGPLLAALNDWAYDYIGEIMVPVLNFMTKGITTFITGQHNGTFFLESVLVVAEKTYTHDDSESERDAKSASTILTCLLECCRVHAPSSIDALIQRIVTSAVNRIGASKSTGLKIRLMEVIMAAIYYNPSMALGALGALGEQASVLVFNTLFELLKDMERDSTERLVVLSFSSILANPAAPLPQIIRDNIQPMFEQIIREVVLVEEEAAKEKTGDDETEDDEDDEEDDGGGDLDVPEGGYDEDEDCLNAEDEAYRESLEAMSKEQRVKKQLYVAGEPVDDEDDDDFVYTSPIESLDVLSFFVASMQQAASIAPELVANLQSRLRPEDVARLETILETARQRAVALALASP